MINFSPQKSLSFLNLLLMFCSNLISGFLLCQVSEDILWPLMFLHFSQKVNKINSIVTKPLKCLRHKSKPNIHTNERNNERKKEDMKEKCKKERKNERKKDLKKQ